MTRFDSQTLFKQKIETTKANILNEFLTEIVT